MRLGLTSRPPAPPSGGLVGREPDLTRLTEALAAERSVLTITGPAGVGKTRVVLELVERFRVASEGELLAVFVPCARVGTRASLLETLADVVEAVDEAPTLDGVAARVREIGSLLVVLDGLARRAALEGAALAKVVGALAHEAPDARVIVTAREPLGVANERVVSLEPLGSADAEALLDALLGALPSRGAPAHEPSAAALAARAGGLPLALELASRLAPRAREAGSAGPSTLEAWVEVALSLASPAATRALSALATLGSALDDDEALAVAGEADALTELTELGLLEPREGSLSIAPFVRELARARASPSVAEAAARAHTAHLARWARPLVERSRRAPAAEHTRELARRAPSTFTALETSLAAGTGELGDLVTLLDALVLAHHPSVPSRLRRLCERALVRAERDGKEGLERAELSITAAHLTLATHVAHVDVAALHAAIAAAEREARHDLAARGLRVAARAALALGRPTESRALLERARHHDERAGDARGRGLTRELEGIAALELGQHAEARAALGEAARSEREHLGPSRTGRSEALLMLCALDEGRTRDARLEGRATVDRARDEGNELAEAMAATWLGLVDRAEGRLEEARLALVSGASFFEERGELRRVALCLAWAAGVLAQLDDPLGAEAPLARARALLGSRAGPAFTTVLELEGAQVLLASERAARIRASEQGGPASPRGGEPVLEHARRVARASRAHAGESVEVRLSLAALEEARRALAGADAPVSQTRDLAIVVHASGTWFRVGRGPQQVLAQRAPRRLLLALARAREGAAAPLSPETLIASGWPGERILPLAARNRLHVAMNALRKAGLRAALLRVDGGYVLDRDLVLRWDDSPLDPALDGARHASRAR